MYSGRFTILNKSIKSSKRFAKIGSADESREAKIAITGSATRDISGSGIGYHVGGDFTYFVHRLMGLGVAVRYSQGTVRLAPEPLTQLNQDFRVGSTLVALTVRIRVDRAFKH